MGTVLKATILFQTKQLVTHLGNSVEELKRCNALEVKET